MLCASIEQAVEGYLADPAAAGFVLGRTISEENNGHAHALLNIQVRPDLPQARTIEYAQQLREFTKGYFSAYSIKADVSGERACSSDTRFPSFSFPRHWSSGTAGASRSSAGGWSHTVCSTGWIEASSSSPCWRRSTARWYGELPGSSSAAEQALERAGAEYGFATSALITPDGEKALIVFEVFFLDEEGEKEMAAILKENAGERDGDSISSPSYRVTGMPLIIADIMDKLFSTQLKTSALALLLCAFLVMLIFRSVYYGLASTSVVFLAIACFAALVLEPSFLASIALRR